MWTPEYAFAEFTKAFEGLKAVKSGINEAQTRLQIIDSILFDVLRWDKAAVDVEKYCRDEGFADYAFVENGDICLILEAKKTGVVFTVPEGEFTGDPVPFGLLASESPAARAALTQALGYAAGLGSRYIAITNGLQWIFTLTFVPNQKLEERLVYVFDSLESIRSRFRLFWDCFSRVGLESNSVTGGLLESRNKPAPSKISKSIPGYPAHSRRNVYANELSYVLRSLWDALAQIEDTPTFIDYCYVQTRSDEDLIAYARNLLRQRAGADRIYFESEVEHAANALTSASVSLGAKPFVILGDVGHGKTTFLNYLRFKGVASELANYVQLQINFIDRPDSAEQVADYVYNQIEQHLLNVFKIDHECPAVSCFIPII